MNSQHGLFTNVKGKHFIGGVGLRNEKVIRHEIFTRI